MMTTSAASTTIPQWKLEGQVVVACNCDFGCPCNFNGRPTPGKCEVGWTWQIEDGRYGDVSLSGLSFSLNVNYPAAIHEGNGEGVTVIDAKANEQQRAAVRNLLSGQAGGPWKILSTTISKTHGPEYVPFQVSFGDFTARVVAGDIIDLKMDPVKNPVTGAEVHPRAVLPEGFIFKDASLGRSSVFRVKGPVSFDHSGRYAASSKYEYSGP